MQKSTAEIDRLILEATNFRNDGGIIDASEENGGNGSIVDNNNTDVDVNIEGSFTFDEDAVDGRRKIAPNVVAPNVEEYSDEDSTDSFIQTEEYQLLQSIKPRLVGGSSTTTTTPSAATVTTESSSQTNLPPQPDLYQSRLFAGAACPPSAEQYRGFDTNFVHRGFDHDEFQRRVLLTHLKHNPTIGHQLNDMGVNINTISREQIEYLKMFLITLDSKLFHRSIDAKFCLMGVEGFRTLVKMLSAEEYARFKTDIDVLEATVKEFEEQSKISVINEVACMSMDNMCSSFETLYKKTGTLLLQAVFKIFLKKTPEIVKGLSEKIYGTTKRKQTDLPDMLVSQPDAKKAKLMR